MLAPDICNFKCHHNHQAYSKCKLDSDTLSAVVSKHFFNHSVCAVFPDTLNLPSNVKECLNNDTEYYKVSKLPVSEFIDKIFIEAFVKRGELTVLSIDKLLDVDDCVAVTPNGTLVLSLQKNTFHELGVDKGPAVDLIKLKFEGKSQLLINLKESCFVPGKKNYDRLLDRLKKTNHLTMDFILSWEPDEDKVCPSSIAAYFHKKGYLVEECIPSRTSRVDYNVKIPLKSTDHEEMFEWLGLRILGAEEYADPAHQEFLSSYIGTDEMETVGQTVCTQWTGLFTTKKILKFLHLVKDYLIERQGIPFIGLHIQGFDDSPVTWGRNVNKYLTCGDNNFSLILFSDGNVFLMKTGL